MSELCPSCGRPFGKRRRCYACAPGRRRERVSRACQSCGTTFDVVASQLNVAGGGRFCSVACKLDARRGVEVTQGTRYVRKDGYVAVKVGVRKYDLEHRLVMSEAIGRQLMPSEHVHHVNGDPADNRLSNLELLTAAEHVALHGGGAAVRQRSSRVAITCERCGKELLVKPSRSTRRFCGNECRLEALHEANRKEAS